MDINLKKLCLFEIEVTCVSRKIGPELDSENGLQFRLCHHHKRCIDRFPRLLALDLCVREAIVIAHAGFRKRKRVIRCHSTHCLGCTNNHIVDRRPKPVSIIIERDQLRPVWI